MIPLLTIRCNSSAVYTSFTLEKWAHNIFVLLYRYLLLCAHNSVFPFTEQFSNRLFILVSLLRVENNAETQYTHTYTHTNRANTRKKN